MPVNWQRFPVNLGVQGLDTKTDQKQSIPGRLTTLDNAVFVTPGRITKRNGLTSWSTAVEGTGSITRGTAISEFGNETLMFDGTYAYSHLASVDKWRRVGVTRSLRTTSSPLFNNTRAFHNPDVAMTGSLALYAYEEYENGFKLPAARCTVVDTVTDTVLINNQALSTTAWNPRCCAYSGSLWVVYGESNSTNIYARKVDPSSPSTLQGAVTLATDAQGNGASGFYGSNFYDGYGHGCKLEVMGLSDRLVLQYSNTRNSSSLALYTGSTPSLYLTTSMNIANSYGFGALWTDPSEQIWVAGTVGGFNGTANVGAMPIRAAVFDKNLNTVMALTNVASSSTFCMRMGGVAVSSSVSSLYYEVSSSQDINRSISVTSFGPNVTPASSSFMRGLTLESKPFAWDGTHYLWTLLPSSVQPTYFLLDADGNVASKAASGLAYPSSRKNPQPSNVASNKSGSFTVANMRVGRLLSSGTLFSLPGVAGATVDFTNTTSSFWSAPLGRQLHVAGGILSSYDGFGFCEHGFHTGPEPLTSVANKTGGSVVSGTYQYVGIYEWSDAYGQVHRSRPSSALTVTVPSGSGGAGVTGSVDITVSTLRLTAKQNRSPVTIGIYRTEDQGDVFYKVTPLLSGVLYNSSSIDSVTFRDTVSDSDLINREILYTAGGVLENDPPPSCTMIASWKNRLWLGGLEDKDTLRHSKLSKYNEPIGFSDFFEVRIDRQGGDIVGIVGMDEQLVVFKQQAIHIIYPLTSAGTALGAGPDDTGNGGEWGQKVIATDIGCISQNSIVLTDRGVFFQSRKGIYLLGRDLSLSYVGAQVEAYNRLTISSANVVADANQVRFATTEGTCLVYDYQVGQWSTFSNFQSVDSAVVNNQHLLLRSDGTVAAETSGSFSDDGSQVPLSVVTGWLTPSGIQGFQRFRRAYVLGDYRGPHSLRVKVGYDYSPIFADEATVNAQSIVDPTGDGTYATDDGQLYEFRFDLSRQKCTALRLSLEDVNTVTTGSNTGEGLTLSNVSLEVGVKQGSPKLRPGRQAGTT